MNTGYVKRLIIYGVVGELLSLVALALAVTITVVAPTWFRIALVVVNLASAAANAWCIARNVRTLREMRAISRSLSEMLLEHLRRRGMQ